MTWSLNHTLQELVTTNVTSMCVGHCPAAAWQGLITNALVILVETKSYNTRSRTVAWSLSDTHGRFFTRRMSQDAFVDYQYEPMWVRLLLHFEVKPPRLKSLVLGYV
jgi:hypothetical protein